MDAMIARTIYVSGLSKLARTAMLMMPNMVHTTKMAAAIFT